MDLVLLANGLLRLFPPRLPGENIKLFAEIIKNEKNDKNKKKYTAIYKGLKFSKWFVLSVVCYMFVVLLFNGK